MRTPQQLTRPASRTVGTRRPVAALAVVAVLAALGLTACGSSSTSAGNGQGAAVKGGTIYDLDNSDIDNLDPARSYNLATSTIHLLVRSLTTWKVQAGSHQITVVPDIATTTGDSSNGGRTWTYHLKSGIKYADGTAISSQDIKFGVERSFSSILSGGPNYASQWLIGGTAYHGPAHGKQLSSITTPDSKTIVFHLNRPIGDFPYLTSFAQFSPVPTSAGVNLTYGNKPMSTGPYKVSSFQHGKQLVLVRNDQWSQSTDPVRTARPDKWVFQLNLEDTIINQRLLTSRGIDADAIGLHTQLDGPTLVKASQQASSRQRITSANNGSLTYLAMNTTSPKLKALSVRQAIEYAVNKKAVQAGAGGPSIAGKIATTLIAPGISGYQNYNAYPAGDSGNPAKAKQLLGGKKLSLDLAVENTQTNQAEAIRQSLSQVGITVTVQPYTPTTYYNLVGQTKKEPDLVLASWTPDWPSASTMLPPLFDGRQIYPTNNYNLSQLNVPAINRAMDTAAGETDEQTAAAMWHKIDVSLMKHAPVVPLVYQKSTFIFGKNVTGTVLPQYPGYYDVLTMGLTT